MVEDSREGFGFRAPRGWYVSAPKHDAVRRTERADGIPLVRSGLTLAQVDHLLGGQIVAELAVVTTEAPPDEPNDCDAAARLVKACEILAPPSRPMASEWPATLAGAPGYQTVLRVVEQELPGRLGEAVDGSLRQMVAIRAACVPVRGGRSRKGYALILRCQATDAAAAAALMARLSTSAFALSAATTQPASQPTSQPLTMPQIATTRPFTQPATSAATRPASQLATSARSTP
jgi:hypothetical protein